jgi:hypothetical protein
MANSNAKPHNRVTMDTRRTLHRPNA